MRVTLIATVIASCLCFNSSESFGQNRVDIPPTDAPIKTASDFLAEDAQHALSVEKDYDAAIDFLREAISSNPDDMGAKYDPKLFQRQQPDDAEHGRKQLLKMLADRPLMNRYLDESDDLWSWAAWKYGAKIAGSKVVWDSSPTDDPNCPAQHHIPTHGEDGTIRIRDLSLDDFLNNKTAAFDRLWSGAVFELHNIENAAEFDELYDRAKSGDVTEEEFVKSMFTIELKAGQRTRKWYVELYLPHAKKYGIPTYPENWSCGDWGSPTSLFLRYTDKEAYPWTPYSRYYAELRASNSPVPISKNVQ
jgi:tetratricopeptide (TPR) repeat protein